MPVSPLLNCTSGFKGHRICLQIVDTDRSPNSETGQKIRAFWAFLRRSFGVDLLREQLAALVIAAYHFYSLSIIQLPLITLHIKTHLQQSWPLQQPLKMMSMSPRTKKPSYRLVSTSPLSPCLPILQLTHPLPYRKQSRGNVPPRPPARSSSI